MSGPVDTLRQLVRDKKRWAKYKIAHRILKQHGIEAWRVLLESNYNPVSSKKAPNLLTIVYWQNVPESEKLKLMSILLFVNHTVMHGIIRTVNHSPYFHAIQSGQFELARLLECYLSSQDKIDTANMIYQRPTVVSFQYFSGLLSENHFDRFCHGHQGRRASVDTMCGFLDVFIGKRGMDPNRISESTFRVPRSSRVTKLTYPPSSSHGQISVRDRVRIMIHIIANHGKLLDTQHFHPKVRPHIDRIQSVFLLLCMEGTRSIPHDLLRKLQTYM